MQEEPKVKLSKLGFFEFLLGGIILGVFVPIILYNGIVLFYRTFPVMTDWRITAINRSGNDLIIVGRVTKNWNCEYIAPPRATDINNNTIDVLSIASASSSNWSPEANRAFGPWILKNAAGKYIDFKYEHICLGFYRAFSHIGTLDDTKNIVN